MLLHKTLLMALGCGALGCGVVGVVSGCNAGAAKSVFHFAAADDGTTDPPPDDPDEPPPPTDEGDPAAFLQIDARRLTRAEIQASVQNVLGVDISADLLSLSPEELQRENADSGLVFAFDNESSKLESSFAFVSGLDAVFANVSARVFATDALRSALMPCTPVSAVDDACMRTFVTTVGRRLWRRPLDAVDVDAIAGFGTTVATEDGDFNAGAALALRTLLMNPEFVYRVEVGDDVADRPELRALNPFEVASRMAFLAWGAGPDDALLDAADANALATPAQRQTALDALLSQPRARTQIGRFHAMWFGYERALLPAELKEKMRAESDALVNRVILDDHAAWTELLTREETFVDDTLAAHYGLPLPGGGATWVSTAGTGRGGLLGQGSFLANGSKFGDTSPTTRGKIIQTLLFCSPALHPDPSLMVNVDEPPPPADNASNCKVDRYARHRNDGRCAGCHAFLDGTGFGLENYDDKGRYRDTEAADASCNIAGEGALPDLGDGLGERAFHGPQELGVLLANTEGVDRCLVTQLYRFATGRFASTPEDAELTRMTSRYRSAEKRFDLLLRDIVMQPNFVFRDISDVGGAP